MVLGERLAQELKELYTKLNNDGKLLSKAQLEGYYETFRKRFGPDQLNALTGKRCWNACTIMGITTASSTGLSLRTMKNSRRISGASLVGAP